ncbi:universal stress protein [Caulobacter sp. UNC279MFTsu5.1]|uniref:universal stress protein n=1 Tax=Caulobacter sp. UNC279MFTsu5.1 TaxID=1502775 RepID=UPI0008E9B0C3|nr:universal stress protein [Caulobacter sp. UNC279MFTsu5.1]SFK03974.1 Nucleotide-binding universal stress protein, UspA family [Caulobacter sp. UNC279MFTsu5.1]
MAFKDILLQLDSYPEPTPLAVIERGVWWARHLQATLTALAVDIQIPVHSNKIADYLIGLTDLARAEEAKSHRQGQDVLAQAAASALRAEVEFLVQTHRAHLYDVGEHVARMARTRDLCIVPLSGRFDEQQAVVRTVVFGSGRPTLILDETAVEARASGCARVVIAWDGGAGAARALADSLPILAKADAVTVLTISGDKPGVDDQTGQDVVRHLRSHGVTAHAKTLASDHSSAGVVIERHVRQVDADLLVMGAYGHSRLRDFVLGGATEHLLHAPPTALWMAHA